MYTQENRLLAIETPLGPDALILTDFLGEEALSSLFSFELSLLSGNHNISFEEIIGKNVTISIKLEDGSERYFNGLIARFRQGRSGHFGGGNQLNYSSTATMVPWFWLLTRTADSRIFQELSVPDIIESIFDDHGLSDYSFRLHSSYEQRNYAVQYRETDFDFISRLLEEEGIFYFFEHEEGKHTLVLADSPDEHHPCPLQEEVSYLLKSRDLVQEDLVSHIEIMKEIGVGKYSLRDFNFETPSMDLEVFADSKQNLGPGEREIYDYPGEYLKRNVGDRLANIRMEEEEAQAITINGESNCRAFTSGYRFKLLDHYREDMNEKEFVLVRLKHRANQAGNYRSMGSSGEELETKYQNTFECIPHEMPFRPARVTTKPVVEGVQTAIVVGPAGEEIYTDEHGRVKVQFHWDREGGRDENSSCWIRVSQLWAGAGWGAMWIPRIGHEVIVDFVEGDPDRPIITGRVYHGSNKPPYPLPIEKTKSTIKSDSSKGGGGSNEFRFEDKAGEEEIFLHGQKDWTIAIENDKNQTVGSNETLSVGNNRDKNVGNDQSEAIGKNKSITVGTDHSEQIGSNKTMNIGANHTETIGSNMSLTVGKNLATTVATNSAETVGAAKELTIGAAFQVSVGAAMNESIGAAKAEEIGASKMVIVGKDLSETVAKTYSHKSKKIVFEAEDEITIKTGKATIQMKKSGDISIQGKKITLKGSGNVVIKGKKIMEN